EALYDHLTNDHVGRGKGLELICRWGPGPCNQSYSKRDHLTSHLRIHVPLKPHSCPVCSRAFKRPQDLKKHEKLH
ncbi:putative transcription factor PacC, partial [Rhizoclosmatium globosum]